MTSKQELLQIQELCTGENLYIASYHFQGGLLGPTIYIQANLHGPEIFGTALLGKIMQRLEILDNFPGQIIIVPCANPMGVQSASYNSLVGRWNLQNGTNWNRIFETNQKWTSRKEKTEYYQKQLGRPNLAIEKKLAAALHLLSQNADFVLDIHTAASESINHLFTYPKQLPNFADLGPHLCVLLSEQSTDGAFDESHVVPFAGLLDVGKLPKVSTWEASNHNITHSETLIEREKQLWNWLCEIWGWKDKKISLQLPEPLVLGIENCGTLVSPVGGYYIWEKEIGQSIKKDEIYASVYNPQANKFTKLKAIADFLLVGKYSIGAIAEGQEIASVGWV